MGARREVLRTADDRTGSPVLRGLVDSDEATLREEDAPYLNGNNEIVLDGAEISAPSTPTSTPTPEPEDPTPTPTDEPEDTPTETETSGQPGFGLVVSLIALIGAALIALRRRD